MQLHNANGITSPPSPPPKLKQALLWVTLNANFEDVVAATTHLTPAFPQLKQIKSTDTLERFQRKTNI